MSDSSQTELKVGFVFNHVSTEVFDNEIILFGRTNKEKSIAVRVIDHRPFVVLICPGITKEGLLRLLEEALRECFLYKLCSTRTEFINATTYAADFGLRIEEVKGRSITTDVVIFAPSWSCPTTLSVSDGVSGSGPRI